MDPRDRIVTKLPLDELWNSRGRLRSARVRRLQPAELPALLRDGPVRFVVADLGTALRWIAVEETFRFWKDEVRQRLADLEAGFALDDFPDGFAYVASLWETEGDNATVVVLEVHH